MSKAMLPPLPATFDEHIKQCISRQMLRCLAHYNEPKLRKNVQKYFEWSEQFARLYYQSRIKRALDLETTEVIEAQNLARHYIGSRNHDFFVTCVDGRNMPTVMFSKPPHIGGVLRSPAGAVTGFMEGQEPGSVYIDHDSYVIKQIVTLLTEKTGDIIFYGLDSHISCAARAQIHATEGGQQHDEGLRADILSKLMTAHGILQLRDELKTKNKEVATIIPIFFSYNPHTGGMYAGLEMHIDDERVAKNGFTPAVIKELLTEEKIVSTFDLLSDTAVIRELSSVLKAKSAKFRDHYPVSLLKNWQATTHLYSNGEGRLFLNILSKLNRAYGLSGWVIGQKDSLIKKTIAEQTLKQKAKFLLKNIVTRFSIAGQEDKWDFDTHREEMIVITDGGYAPFPKIDAFAVFSRDLNALLTNTKLTIDLIRTFRRNGLVSDVIADSKISPEEFISAPVLIVNKAILKEFQEKSWTALESLHIEKAFETIDWDDPKTLNWKRSDLEKLIAKSVQGHHIEIDLRDTLIFLDGIYELFDRIRIMMRDKYFRQMILHGNIIVLNTLLDRDRTPKLLTHFVI